MPTESKAEGKAQPVSTIQNLIAGAVLTLMTWQMYTTHELTKNQTLLLWRVEVLEKVDS